METYRRHILQTKNKYGTARCLCHYLGYIRSYLECKRQVITNERS
jgi:hypothetical protein